MDLALRCPLPEPSRTNLPSLAPSTQNLHPLTQIPASPFPDLYADCSILDSRLSNRAAGIWIPGSGTWALESRPWQLQLKPTIQLNRLANSPGGNFFKCSRILLSISQGMRRDDLLRSADPETVHLKSAGYLEPGKIIYSRLGIPFRSPFLCIQNTS